MIVNGRKNIGTCICPIAVLWFSLWFLEFISSSITTWHRCLGDNMGRSSQRKGRGGELELARIFREHGYDVRPGQAVSFGAVPDLEGLPGVHIECKRVERLNIPEAMEQSIRDSEKFKDGMPALFHRRNRHPWLVTMRMADWLEIYRKAYNG